MKEKKEAKKKEKTELEKKTEEVAKLKERLGDTSIADGQEKPVPEENTEKTDGTNEDDEESDEDSGENDGEDEEECDEEAE